MKSWQNQFKIVRHLKPLEKTGLCQHCTSNQTLPCHQKVKKDLALASADIMLILRVLCKLTIFYQRGYSQSSSHIVPCQRKRRHWRSVTSAIYREPSHRAVKHSHRAVKLASAHRGRAVKPAEPSDRAVKPAASRVATESECLCHCHCPISPKLTHRC